MHKEPQQTASVFKTESEMKVLSKGFVPKNTLNSTSWPVRNLGRGPTQEMNAELPLGLNQRRLELIDLCQKVTN